MNIEVGAAKIYRVISLDPGQVIAEAFCWGSSPGGRTAIIEGAGAKALRSQISSGG